MCSLLQGFTSLIFDCKRANCGSAESGPKGRTSPLSPPKKLQVEAAYRQLADDCCCRWRSKPPSLSQSAFTVGKQRKQAVPTATRHRVALNLATIAVMSSCCS